MNQISGLRQAGVTKFCEVFDQALPLSPDKYERLARSIYTSVYSPEVARYECDVDPFQVTYVDPQKIKLLTGRAWKPWSSRRDLIGTVRGGDWDIDQPRDIPKHHSPYPKQFEELPKFHSFRNHFVNGVSWEETQWFTQLESAVASPDLTRYSTMDDVYTRLNQIDELYSVIEKNGYKTQLEMSGRCNGYLESVLNEVNIDVSRDGKPLFVDGRHRLCIAKLLDIERIPVFVLVRHSDWVRELEVENLNSFGDK